MPVFKNQQQNFTRITVYSLCFLVLAASTSCSVKPGDSIAAEKVASSAYLCSDGSLLKADYFRLSDGSLSFVRLSFSDGETCTLPQQVSASGARYTDEFRFLFWIKGDSMSLQRMSDRGEWGAEITGKAVP